ncbi:hypothetical protein APE_0855.1 [Aeropyrum pernix spindle-shaped virus 1]|uniref:Uncharacterized protein n=2 Tax=root TaxID=1 RepID=Q9YDR2_AERPE|nr:hypothetical protein [Aeropyrum pernix]BAA79835.2 hypothetical protein APE_0855.1 [Aeropyrum pernix spindle-shaped virus 1] [Aeropyrum pernix K1]
MMRGACRLLAVFTVGLAVFSLTVLTGLLLDALDGVLGDDAAYTGVAVVVGSMLGGAALILYRGEPRGCGGGAAH